MRVGENWFQTKELDYEKCNEIAQNWICNFGFGFPRAKRDTSGPRETRVELYNLRRPGRRPHRR